MASSPQRSVREAMASSREGREVVVERGAWSVERGWPLAIGDWPSLKGAGAEKLQRAGSRSRMPNRQRLAVTRGVKWCNRIGSNRTPTGRSAATVKRFKAPRQRARSEEHTSELQSL